MKRLLLLLVLLPLFTCAQNISLQEAGEYADSLVKKEILKDKGRVKLLKLIGSKSIEVDNPFAEDVTGSTYTNTKPSKEAILQFCATAFNDAMLHRMAHKTDIEQKIVAEDSLIVTNWSVSLNSYKNDDEDLVHPNRSTIGFTRTRTLEDFRAIGLISDTVYRECKDALLTRAIKNEAELIMLMVNRSVYYSYYEFNLDKQKEYINKLAAAGILPQEGKVALLRSYQPLELKTIPQILAFSHRFLPVDVDSLSPEPQLIYPYVFKTIRQLVPEFKYEDLQVKLQDRKEGDMIEQQVALHFTIDSQLYTHVFFHDLRKEIPDAADPGMAPLKIDQDFHKGVNKWLTDRESAYRLHIVNMPDEKRRIPFASAKAGLIMLRADEVELISRNPYIMSQESFDLRLGRKHIYVLMDALCEQGLLGDIEQTAVDSLKERVATGELGSIPDLFDSVHNILVPVYWETVNLKDPYRELTQNLVQSAKGVFTLSKITDEFEKGATGAKKIKYGFTMNNKRYETMLDYKDDWLDPAFVNLIKKALKEQQVHGTIYDCRSGEGLVFLNPGQYAFLKEYYHEVFEDE